MKQHVPFESISRKELKQINGGGAGVRAINCQAYTCSQFKLCPFDESCTCNTFTRKCLNY